MIDESFRMPHKLNELTGNFEKIGKKRATLIVAGVDGLAMIKGQFNNKLYGWVESEKKWKKKITNSRVRGMGFGQKGRLYKIAKNNNRLY